MGQLWSENLPKSGMTASGKLWVLTMPAHHIEENDGSALGSWSTPQVDDSKNVNPKDNRRETLVKQVNQTTANWPTATARDWKGSSPGAVTRKDGKSRMDLLDYAAEQSQLGPQDQANQTSGEESLQSDQTSHPPLPKTLSPIFVEWLMGVPIGWTRLKPLETESYRLWWHSFSGDYSDIR